VTAPPPTPLAPPSTTLLLPLPDNHSLGPSPLPTRPASASRPSVSITRRGVQFVNYAPPSPPLLPPTSPQQDNPQEILDTSTSIDTESDLLFPPILSQDLYLPETEISPINLLRLTFTALEKIFFTSSDQILTSIYENKVVVNSRLNCGLSMVLEPDFEAEVQLYF
jgi:hypothetical protein